MIDYFGTSGEHVTEVNAYLQNSKLLISNDWTNGAPVKLKVLHIDIYKWIYFYFYVHVQEF